MAAGFGRAVLLRLGARARAAPTHAAFGCAPPADRCIIIDRENKMLLKRMQEVVTHQQMDCWLVPKKAQSNWLARKYEQQRIVHAIFPNSL